MKSKVSSEELTGRLMVQSRAGFVKGKGFLRLRMTAVRLVNTFRLRSFYTRPAKFTSHDRHDSIQ
jgi:hypothetical protein